ncbi:MAG: orotidine-5'-phosphate decarboxylase [Gammaproteobacteria bacterium]|nr:MAG: orotidine-5'-phosphate decarboxylase [Pseudomonadota bacterium]PIE38963.1 MAG: orotidine-5'-phosphate decarboxylase [Gammaproteobacteria bacterium]
MREKDHKRVIVALDFDDSEKACAMADRLDPSLCRVKVGKELYTRCGPVIVERLLEKGFEIFLDLKFHDIPNTAASAVMVAAGLGVWMVNVHAGGGGEMMQECARRLSERRSVGLPVPLLIGVTVLTSMDAQGLAQVGVPGNVDQQVLRLAGLAQKSGMDGVVCSAQESALLKQALGDDFILVTPGIRPACAATNDQKRIVTPSDAIRDGSDYLVIGRPVTAADDPLEALNRIQAEISAS